MAGRPVSRNSNRTRAFVAIGVSGFVLLFMNQNCAPAGMGSPASGSASKSEPGSPVSVIDDVKSTTGLVFNYKQIELTQDASSTLISGVCSELQEGAVLGYRVRRMEADGKLAEDFARGYVNCSGGSFRIEVSPAQDLVCGQTYKVIARLGLGTPGEAEISRHCN